MINDDNISKEGEEGFVTEPSGFSTESDNDSEKVKEFIKLDPDLYPNGVYDTIKTVLEILGVFEIFEGGRMEFSRPTSIERILTAISTIKVAVGKKNNSQDHSVNDATETKESDLPKNYVHEFNFSTKEIVNAVIHDIEIDGINVAQKVQDPKFRFTSKISSELSAADLSEAFSVILAKARSNAGKKGSAKTNQKRSKKADEYAIKMFKVINNLKAEGDVSSFRATVALLKEKGIDTPNGGEWSTNTLQDLQKRWKNLGLIPDESAKLKKLKLDN